jgi:aspartate ammonia-lyase
MADHRADKAFHRSIHTLDFAGGATRTETDSLGTKQIPADAYWGLNVSRALENFPISGRPISTYPVLIFGYACLKTGCSPR